MIIGDFESPSLREHTVDGKPRWQWATARPDLTGYLEHQVWLNADDKVMWEVWFKGSCLGVRDTGKTGEEDARKWVARVRKNGQDNKFANAVYKAHLEAQG